MNQTGGKAPSTPRLSEYATNALEKIRKELRMFSIADVHNISNTTNGQAQITSHNVMIQNQVQCDITALITHLVTTGYTEEQAIAFIKSNGRSELPVSPQPLVPPQQLPPKLFRKPSIEREIPQYQQRGSDSGAGSSRSNSTTDSATIYDHGSCKPIEYCKQIEYCKPIDFKPKRISPAPPIVARGTSPNIARNGQMNQFNQNSNEPPPPYPIIAPNVTNLIQNRQSPTQSNAASTTGSSSNYDGHTYAGHYESHMNYLGDYRKSPSSGIYSAASAGSPSPVPPPNSISPHPAISRSTNVCQKNENKIIGSWQRKTHSPIIMQSVKSTQVQKPVLQTAIAPQVPTTTSTTSVVPSYTASNNTPPTTPPVLNPSQISPSIINGNTVHQSSSTSNLLPVNEPPSYASTMAFKASQQLPRHLPPPPYLSNASDVLSNKTLTPPLPPTPSSSVKTQSSNNKNHIYPATMNDALMETAATVSPAPPTPSPTGAVAAAAAAAVAAATAAATVNIKPGDLIDSHLLPGNTTDALNRSSTTATTATDTSELPIQNRHRTDGLTAPAKNHDGSISMVPTQATTMSSVGRAKTATRKVNKQPVAVPTSSNRNASNNKSDDSNNNINNINFNNKNQRIAAKNNKQADKSIRYESPNEETKGGTSTTAIRYESPIPERKFQSKDQEKEGRIKHYSPQAFKFFMEQHIENVLKSYKQRLFRRNQLEREMCRINLSEETQVQMRRMLNQKESNYIRLKRAKMEKSMFTKLKTIGVGAFGEVALVKKIDTPNLLYAMKTLKKADVLKRNQVAHVKAERDILAEADNGWVVKLYYSFQDRDNLYFVMDYIPGGDMMSLLIKLGIFSEELARFYIAELTLAVESVHKMGFIHRDIKPDNILIDKDGHIKLTDFGLCTGFRWTHDSKYYQKAGEHARQDSMEPWDDKADGTKPAVLERRRQRDVQRCLAHSLVGTPNYIAPEVLVRSGYTQLCDWWSVGVILYEMLVGQPPFLANTAVETQQKVINWEQTLHIQPQSELSPEATDLILRLCSSAERRLGKNANEVKDHAFFQSIDFSTDLRQQKAPYIPKIEHPTDTSNFDEVDPERIQNSDQFDFNNGTANSFHGFYGFTYRRFFTGENNDEKSNQPDSSDQDSPVYV